VKMHCMNYLSSRLRLHQRLRSSFGERPVAASICRALVGGSNVRWCLVNKSGALLTHSCVCACVCMCVHVHTCVPFVSAALNELMTPFTWHETPEPPLEEKAMVVLGEIKHLSYILRYRRAFNAPLIGVRVHTQTLLF